VEPAVLDTAWAVHPCEGSIPAIQSRDSINLGKRNQKDKTEFQKFDVAFLEDQYVGQMTRMTELHDFLQRLPNGSNFSFQTSSFFPQHFSPSGHDGETGSPHMDGRPSL